MGPVFVLIGALAFGGAFFEWEWFMTHHKARLFVRLLGYRGARFFYMLAGAGLVAGGLATFWMHPRGG